MRRENGRRASRNLASVLDKHRPPRPQVVNHNLVVDDLMAHIHRPVVPNRPTLQRQLHRPNRPLNPRTKPPRRSQQHNKRHNLRKLIITYARFSVTKIRVGRHSVRWS